MPNLGFSGTSAGMTQIQSILVERHIRRRRGWVLHHGDCVGADAEAHDIASGKNGAGLRIIVHPPDNPSKRAFCEGYDEIRSAAPYLTRNGHIVAEADELLAAPESGWERQRSGTWATVRRARKKGIPILIVAPDGSETWENPQSS